MAKVGRPRNGDTESRDTRRYMIYVPSGIAERMEKLLATPYGRISANGFINAALTKFIEAEEKKQ